jgi:hypothetical protein
MPTLRIYEAAKIFNRRAVDSQASSSNLLAYKNGSPNATGKGGVVKRIARSFSLLFCLSCCAQLVVGQTLTENFAYGVTDNSDIRKVAIVGVDTVWTRHSGAQGPVYKAAGLTYTGYALSGIGGSLGFTHGSSGVNDGDVNRKLSDSVGTTNNVYVSFMVRIDSAFATPDYFFHLGPYFLSTTFRSRVFVRANGTGWSLGLSKSTEAAVNDTTVLNFGQTYLVIIKYSFNAATTSDDVVTLYLYSSGVPSIEPGSPRFTMGPVGAGTGSDPGSIGSVAIREGTNTPVGTIDGIRVSTSFSGVVTAVESNDNLPQQFSLSQNYPNPFNPSTTIEFSLPRETFTTLQVYDMLGREVATLVNEMVLVGRHRVQWNPAGMPSGVYTYRVTAGSFVEARTMTLLK